jgi:hypothetical protein
MTRYKQAEFEDEDSSSIGSVALNSEGISTSATHIRYHSVSFRHYPASSPNKIADTQAGLCSQISRFWDSFSRASGVSGHDIVEGEKHLGEMPPDHLRYSAADDRGARHRDQ